MRRIGTIHAIQAFALVAGLALTACGPGPAATSTGKSEIHGTIVRDGGQPLSAARVLLLDGADKELRSLKTGANGDYSFPNLAAGNYRVRFSLQADNAPNPVIEYKGTDARSTEYFAQVTSQSVSLDGSGKSVGVSPMSVAWKSFLSPADGHVSTNGFPDFSWQAAPNATSYAFELLNTDGSPFYRSPDQSGLSFHLTELKGNQGSSNGQALKGAERLFRVRVGLNPGTAPGAESGYSTAARLQFD